MRSNNKECEYCGGVIFFEEDFNKARKSDGSTRWSCYNAETNTIHDCPQGPWKKHLSEAEMWKILYKLPIYCQECMCYYNQNKLCTHLIEARFRIGIDFPGKFHEKFMSEQKKSSFKKKNSTTLYNREEFQQNLDLIL